MANQIFEGFEDYRRQLSEGLLKSHEQFDKTLTLISSGGLALSMAFVEKLGGPNPISPGWLVATWVFLGLTLLLSLTSSLISVMDYKEVAKDFDKVTEKYSSIDWENEGLEKLQLDEHFARIRKFEAETAAASEMYKKHVKLVERKNRDIELVTFAPYITLLMGVMSLITFASINILTQKQDGQRTTTSNSAGKTERIETRHKRNSSTDTTKDATVSPKKPKK